MNKKTIALTEEQYRDIISAMRTGFVCLDGKLVCDYLGYSGIGSHSFRKYFATSIYVNNHYGINLVRILLQHSSTVTTQRYIGLHSKDIENALQNHIKLL